MDSSGGDPSSKNRSQQQQQNGSTSQQQENKNPTSNQDKKALQKQGRKGRRQQIKQIAQDPKQPRNVRGWFKQEQNQIARKSPYANGSIPRQERLPWASRREYNKEGTIRYLNKSKSGMYELAHKPGKEAMHGHGYLNNSDLKLKADHKAQTKVWNKARHAKQQQNGSDNSSKKAKTETNKSQKGVESIKKDSSKSTSKTNKSVDKKSVDKPTTTKTQPNKDTKSKQTSKTAKAFNSSRQQKVLYGFEKGMIVLNVAQDTMTVMDSDNKVMDVAKLAPKYAGTYGRLAGAAVEIYDSDDKLQTTLEIGAELGGAELGGMIGAAIGTFGGPFAWITIPAGTVLGSFVGGLGARKVVQEVKERYGDDKKEKITSEKQSPHSKSVTQEQTPDSKSFTIEAGYNKNGCAEFDELISLSDAFVHNTPIPYTEITDKVKISKMIGLDPNTPKFFEKAKEKVKGDLMQGKGNPDTLATIANFLQDRKNSTDSVRIESREAFQTCFNKISFKGSVDSKLLSNPKKTLPKVLAKDVGVIKMLPPSTSNLNSITK